DRRLVAARQRSLELIACRAKTRATVQMGHQLEPFELPGFRWADRNDHEHTSLGFGRPRCHCQIATVEGEEQGMRPSPIDRRGALDQPDIAARARMAGRGVSTMLLGSWG